MNECKKKRHFHTESFVLDLGAKYSDRKKNHWTGHAHKQQTVSDMSNSIICRCINLWFYKIPISAQLLKESFLFFSFFFNFLCVFNLPLFLCSCKCLRDPIYQMKINVCRFIILNEIRIFFCHGRQYFQAALRILLFTFSSVPLRLINTLLSLIFDWIVFAPVFSRVSGDRGHALSDIPRHLGTL